MILPICQPITQLTSMPMVTAANVVKLCIVSPQKKPMGRKRTAGLKVRDVAPRS